MERGSCENENYALNYFWLVAENRCVKGSELELDFAACSNDHESTCHEFDDGSQWLRHPSGFSVEAVSILWPPIFAENPVEPKRQSRRS